MFVESVIDYKGVLNYFSVDTQQIMLKWLFNLPLYRFGSTTLIVV